MSNGQFWIGPYGFLYKKNVGVGARRSTRMGPGLNANSNQPTDLNNKYSPGGGGVGASSVANRRAKNRLATICGPNRNCFPCYKTLGLYSQNPNGFYFCLSTPTIPSPVIPVPVIPVPVVPTPVIPTGAILVDGNVSANMTTSGMTLLTFPNNDDAFKYLPFTGMDFYFFGTNYGNSDGTIPAKSIYITTNSAFGFGTGYAPYFFAAPSFPAIYFDFFDSWNIASYVSPPQTGTITGLKYVRIVATGTDYSSRASSTVKKSYEIYYVRDNYFQYMQFNCSVEDAVGFNRSQYNQEQGSRIANGTAYQYIFGSTVGSFGNQPPNTGGPQAGGSYVIRSDLNGNNWQFFPNTHLVL